MDDITLQCRISQQLSTLTIEYNLARLQVFWQNKCCKNAHYYVVDLLFVDLLGQSGICKPCYSVVLDGIEKRKGYSKNIFVRQKIDQVFGNQI